MIYSETYNRRNVFFVRMGCLFEMSFCDVINHIAKNFDRPLWANEKSFLPVLFFVRSCFQRTFICVIIEYHRSSPLRIKEVCKITESFAFINGETEEIELIINGFKGEVHSFSILK